MANVKISELPVASAANQDQVIPIVDGADTKKISVDSVLNIASGVKAGFDTVDGSYIQCEDTGNVISVSGHYIPANNAMYDIGSATNKIRDLYVDSNSLHVGTLTISESADNELVLPPCELTGSLLPDTNAAYDLGSAEFKIRHLYLSDSSIYMGNDPLSDGNKISVANDELVFTNVDGVTTSKPCLMPTSIPTTNASPGKVGQMAVDETYLYICAQPDQWNRVPIASLPGLETSWGV